MLSISMIEMAARRLEGVCVRTPILESQRLNDALGCRIVLKPECLQRTGSFKLRGAYNKIAGLSDDERRRGVLAYSSGNHAQGVAAAAKALGVQATIVMPQDAPLIKQRNTAEYGARIVFYDRYNGDREAIAQSIAEQTGAVLVPPYDDYEVMAGQGTVGLEFLNQLQTAEIAAELLLCPVGGGGLMAGVSTVFAEFAPAVHLYAAEPERFDDTKRSLQQGARVANEPGFHSICDSILAPTPGALTFEVNRHTLSGGFAVAESEIRRAMVVLFEEFKLVAEPGGAAAMAAALAHHADFRARTVAVVVSGGNVDLQQFCRFCCGADQS